MWLVEVAEICRLEGSLEGGFSIICRTEDELNEAIKELEAEIADETFDDVYYFHSLKWFVTPDIEKDPELVAYYKL